ncbi:MAG: CDP-diacylglycerol--glycerol-3-phosphate 3-phosphatidyltransferase [Rhodobacteraceae bacterium]|jgi:CDP-diacylglycerol--glycerol-3-phosphate 3-phosphatidyltransferase|nr:CDP-diacylglycerol--glycerol-3-phosphate 3-phosphatidyltransferase [Paracoccaceae bacterium]
MNWTVPNILTTLRLLAAPGVAVMFLYFHRPWADWCALILFLGAAITDWFDGYLARAWHQESKVGAMLDPIADKAMVVIALAVILGYSSMSPWLVLPATVILFREVFVSGLREYLGQVSGTLKVTKLAKWKTTVQMVAIAVLFSQGVFEHNLAISLKEFSDVEAANILNGSGPDTAGLRTRLSLMTISGNLGLALLWIAALLTAITGWEYFRKALPHLKD